MKFRWLKHGSQKLGNRGEHRIELLRDAFRLDEI